MNLTVKMMATISVIAMIVAAIVTVNSDSWIAGLLVVAGILLFEGLGYSSLIILPMWKYKSTGKMSLPLSSWQGRALQWAYGDGIYWRIAMMREPKYSSLCYLGSCIWISAHGYVFIELFCHKLVYRIILTSIGHFFRFIYQRIMIPIGRGLNKPLLPSMPWWMAIFFGLIFTTGIILPDGRQNMAKAVIALTLVMLALAAIVWIFVGIVTWFKETDFKSYFKSINDPTGNLVEKYFFWWIVMWLLTLLLSPLAFWYDTTVFVLWSIFGAIWVLVLFCAVAGIVAMSVDNSVFIRDKAMGWIFYALLYGGWLWFCHYHTRVGNTNMNIFLGVAPVAIALGIMAFKGIRKVSLALTDDIQKRRQAKSAKAKMVPVDMNNNQRVIKKRSVAVATKPKVEPEPSWGKFFGWVAFWLFLWIVGISSFWMGIASHHLPWYGWVFNIFWIVVFLPLCTITQLRSAIKGLTVSDRVADWAQHSHENLENLEGKLCPIVVPSFTGANPDFILEIVNRSGESSTMDDLAEFIGWTIDRLIKSGLHLSNLDMSYSDVYSHPHKNIVNRREVDDNYVVQDGDMVKISWIS